MNLTNVKYQDSCIFLGLNGSQNERENEAFLRKIRNVYVVYKIKLFDRQVRETILIGKKDLFAVKKETLIKFELNQLQNPEECEFEIVSVKINFTNIKVKELIVEKTFSFPEIRSFTPIGNKVREPSRISNNKREKKLLNMTHSTLPPKLKPKPAIEPEKWFEETKITSGGLTIIEEITPISTIVEKVESNIKSKVDAETKKLDMDIKNLCFEGIDLLLSNLPQPERVEEYRTSNAMIKSIHRYINNELLQNEHEEIARELLRR